MKNFQNPLPPNATKPAPPPAPPHPERARPDASYMHPKKIAEVELHGDVVSIRIRFKDRARADQAFKGLARQVEDGFVNFIVDRGEPAACAEGV